MFQLAQRIFNPQIDPAIANLGGWEFLQLNIPRFITLLFIIAILLFFFIFVIGAIQWITSGGDKGAIEDAKRKIINAITGLIILLLLYFIVAVINWAFGTNLGQVQLPRPLPTVIDSGVCTCVGGNPEPPPNSTCNTGATAQCTTLTECVCNPPSPQQNACVASGGTWRIYNWSAFDYCGSPFGVSIPDTYGCDCGATACWDQTVGSCVSTLIPSAIVGQGTCGCDLGVPLMNSCVLPAVPQCFGQFTCTCIVPAATPVPPSRFVGPPIPGN